MNQCRAALIVAIDLMLLPVLYVGSYFVLVVPGGWQASPTPQKTAPGTITMNYSYPSVVHHYRSGGRWSDRFFWPLEQIDRKVRPGAWRPEPIVY